LSDAVVTVSELERIDVTITPGDAAPSEPARLGERPFALVLRDLELRYGDHLAFREPDRRLSLEGMLLISGPNGAGKSTLAAAIAGVLRPARGVIALASSQGERECGQVEREQLLFVPQEPVMVTGLSVRENMVLLVPTASDESMRAALLRVGLDIALDRSMGALSRGQKHRVGIARALLAAPVVLVLDEPDAWLDTASRATLVRVLLEESALRCVVVISHRDDLRASASTHVVIDNGRIESVAALAQRTA
jgi:ABC-type transport system involved in cytochrome bd biosynthesis fused ATPase/permease subunit